MHSTTIKNFKYSISRNNSSLLCLFLESLPRQCPKNRVYILDIVVFFHNPCFKSRVVSVSGNELH